MTADHFSRNVMISIAGHLLVVLLIFFRAVNAPSERIDLRNAIRVDVVGLPQKAQQLPELPAEKPAPVAPAAKDLPQKEQPAKARAPEVSINSKAKQKDLEKAQKHAINKLNAMDALSKIKADVEKEKANKRSAVAGNVTHQGNALSGLDKIEMDRYYDELQTKLHGAWNIPQWLAEQDLKAEVQVVIDDRGFVIKKHFEKSSGNPVFDAKVNEAIDACSPFSPPPQRLRGLLASEGIVFKFPQ